VLSEGFSLRPPHTQHSDLIITPAIAAASPTLALSLKAYFKTNDLKGLFSKGTVCREMQLQTVLSEKYFFAGRCLRQAVVEPSKFAVIADSAEVVIYIISSEQVALLGEKLATELLSQLSRSVDPDCPPDQLQARLLEDFARWSKYKRRVVSRVLRRTAAKD
jgi:hypothetical protein